MKKYFLRKYFALVNRALYMSAAFPEKKTFSSKSKTFFYNRVWPVAYFSFFVPLMLMTVAKAVQFANQKKWDEFLEVMHMYFLGTNTMYVVIAVQKTAIYYKMSMDIVRSRFCTASKVNLRKKLYVGFLVTFVVCYVFKAVACAIYQELSFQVWVPFVDNEKKFPTNLFTAIGLYQILAAIVVFIVNGILSPFVIVITSAIIEEIHYLIQQVECLVYISKDNNSDSMSSHKVQHSERKENLLKMELRKGDSMEKDTFKQKNCKSSFTVEEVGGTFCTSEEECRCFITNIVSHHMVVKSLLNKVTKIHKYVFLTQFVFTIGHSCFLAFNVYYTRNHVKILLKYSPYLLLSYYLLYLFCHNGQRLSNSCDRLFNAFYWCPWYDCPLSFRKSLLIVMSATLQPATLSGGLFKATLATFLHGLQQTVSYTLLLNQLAPDKNLL